MNYNYILHFAFLMNTRITKKTQYAVSAMLELAKSNTPLPVSVISAKQCIEKNYMSLILLELKNKNLVESIKGAKGGYKISHPLNVITVSQIMSAVGESITVTRCKKKDISCLGKNIHCAAHNMWIGLELKIDEYLSSITLYDVLNSNGIRNDFSIRTI